MNRYELIEEESKLTETNQDIITVIEKMIFAFILLMLYFVVRFYLCQNCFNFCLTENVMSCFKECIIGLN